ncbi:hypothetical protein CspeluHIS016_0104040 [Cutaneotrichosporon spelunceum]|uniref:NADH-ubiquinone oxidoreductase 9.5 kDa subunit n=1 Tax=Cutaneotrichosporon spelunceum TaxID=1672016 RepID=A0AAD3TMQ8_9TREE|nr:hypothetical protein CspeluHIS016_0104040 [Cutaneotrichosporon spelunceum]
MSAIYRAIQRTAHEQPVIFYSLVIGFTGPALVFAVPPIRKRMGWQPVERIPQTFPVPNRPRRAVAGFEDA